MSVQPIPDGFHTITPFMMLDDVAAQLDFLAAAFDAEEIERVTLPDGSIKHAQVRIGNSMVMMGGARDDWPAMQSFLHLYVTDVDGLYSAALSAGATSVQEPRDEFYGDRTAGVKDPFGNLWWIAVHQEDVTADEMLRRMQAAQGDPGA